jgi:hypothetical protein
MRNFPLWPRAALGATADGAVRVLDKRQQSGNQFVERELESR